MSQRPYTTQELEEFRERAVATAMLLGEPTPIICSCCLGRRITRAIFGHKTCGQCAGSGYDLLCSGTAKALGIFEELEAKGYYDGGRKW